MHMYVTSALQRTDMKAVGLQLALDLLHEKVILQIMASQTSGNSIPSLLLFGMFVSCPSQSTAFALSDMSLLFSTKTN